LILCISLVSVGFNFSAVTTPVSEYTAILKVALSTVNAVVSGTEKELDCQLG